MAFERIYESDKQTDLMGTEIDFKETGNSVFCNSDTNFGLSSLPESYEFKESDECSLSSVKYRRSNLSWKELSFDEVGENVKHEQNKENVELEKNEEIDSGSVISSGFCNSDLNLALSSSFESVEFKKSNECPYPLLAVKCQRTSSDWGEELNFDLGINYTIENVKREEKIVVIEKEVVEKTPKDIKVRASDSGEIKRDFQDLQYGIGVSLGKLPKCPARDLLMTDFATVEELSFSKQGPNVSKTSFVLKAYAPIAFRYFRDLFDITTEDFTHSICDAPLDYFSSCGKSGSTFLTTHDDRFILKTIPKKATEFLMRLFPGYFLNITQHRKTLLPKFYGLFSYLKGVKTTRVLIMNNILPMRYKFFQVYDLKGSTYSKRKHQAKTTEEDKTDIVILKDLDFLENWPDGFYLNCDIHKILLRSIERDCKVLESYNIMDYSLLLGVIKSEILNSPQKMLSLEKSSINAKRDKHLIGPFEAQTVTGNTVYLFMGIIDILQSYTLKKKLELTFRSLRYNSKTISVNRPDFYSRRFRKFLSDSVFKCLPSILSL